MPIPFYKRLALNKWLFSLFGVEKFEDLAKHLTDDNLEGFDEDNISKFVQVIILRLPVESPLAKEQLLGYDENIVRHWKAMATPRSHGGQLITPKYFQFLSLLFTEVYLEKYFQNKEGLLNELNTFLAGFNADLKKADQVSKFKLDELNKLAFWNATGSGKTLLMHINILQYKHYLKKYGHERELNRIILLTPNEGLSIQHMEEFKLSKMPAHLFRKDQTSRHLKQIEIIDIHKLKDNSGEKTVAVDSFEGNNLVLVDEGHKGSGGREWMEKRNKLCEEGFSFEYSATFGQALKAANKPKLTEQYAKCILFDYSYRYFYKDGYGKDYKILNLSEGTDEDRMHLYLSACLLSFYQQARLYEDGYRELRPFNIHKPLWVFVGRTVTKGKSKANTQSASDVTAILSFLSIFTKEKQRSIEAIDRILKGQDGLTDAQGRSVFTGTFGHIKRHNLSSEEMFNDVLTRVFNSRSPGHIHVEHLKGSDGEIALKVGENNAPFGVINVGAAKELWNMCGEVEELVTIEKEFSESLFQTINDDKSTINLLIGSKKFTEGWNSWRVSTMGLMNFGKKEGSEIVQFFGRGVRLKGYNFCLKRSAEVRGIKKPDFIRTCETLNIFGVHADYMQQFKEYLEEEGLPAEVEEFVLPAIRNLGKVKLKVPSVSDDIDFKKEKRTSLGTPPEVLKKRRFTLDWYPKIQTIVSDPHKGAFAEGDKNEVHLAEEHLAFINWDAVFFELVRYKNERSWYNFNLSKPLLKGLVLEGGWYTLLIPEEEIAPTSFTNIRRCQEVIIALLKKYCDRFYGYKKDEFEKPHMRYKEIAPDDPNFFDEYRIAIDKSADSIIDEVKALQEAIENDDLKDMGFQLQSFTFQQHLYYPLLHVNGKKTSDLVKVTPVTLNEGEKEFVFDLRKFYDANKSWFNGRELYLLRNLSKGKGIGFFEAENFHPDFILWLVEGAKQSIAFIDPKGILRLRGLEDPKIMFFEKIKELEERLKDDDVTLTSFIISNTRLEDVKWWSGGDAVEFSKRNVLFQKDHKDVYIKTMLERLV